MILFNKDISFKATHMIKVYSSSVTSVSELPFLFLLPVFGFAEGREWWNCWTQLESWLWLLCRNIYGWKKRTNRGWSFRVSVLHERQAIWAQGDMTMLILNGTDKDFWLYWDRQQHSLQSSCSCDKYGTLFTKKEMLQGRHVSNSPHLIGLFCCWKDQ